MARAVVRVHPVLLHAFEKSSSLQVCYSDDLDRFWVLYGALSRWSRTSSEEAMVIFGRSLQDRQNGFQTNDCARNDPLQQASLASRPSNARILEQFSGRSQLIAKERGSPETVMRDLILALLGRRAQADRPLK